MKSYASLEKEKKNVFFSYFISGIPKFSYMGFFRKCSMFHRSIPFKKRKNNKKKSRTSLPISLSAQFWKISLARFYYLTKIRSLVTFTSWDIGQRVYCNCLWTKLWDHRFWNQSYLSNQTVFSRTKKAFKMK